MINEKYHPNGYNIGMNCGKATGQSVMHIHVHLIPRKVEFRKIWMWTNIYYYQKSIAIYVK